MKPYKQTSAYSKMYLVTPSVYEKLLTCLDEKEKRITEEMNIEKDISTEERPAEKYIEMLNKEALNIDPQAEIAPDIPEQIEQQQQQQQPQEIMQQEPQQEIIQPEEITSGEIIQPSEIIAQAPISTLKTKERGKKYICSVCLKSFDRPWSLKRHISTVHKNLGEVNPLVTRPVRPTQIVAVPSETYNDPEDIPLAKFQRTRKMQTDPEDVPLAQLRRTKKIIPQTFQPVLTEEDIEMQQVQNPLNKPCSKYADESLRVIPEESMIFKPKLLVPSIKKSIPLHKYKRNVPIKEKQWSTQMKVSRRKPILVPSIMKTINQPSTSFEQWGTKKPQARTSSEAHFKEKPAKWRPGDDDFPRWQ